MNGIVNGMWVVPVDDQVRKKLWKEYGLTRRNEPYFVFHVEKGAFQKASPKQSRDNNRGFEEEGEQNGLFPYFVRDTPTHASDEEITHGMVLQKSRGRKKRRFRVIKYNNRLVLFSMFDFEPVHPP